MPRTQHVRHHKRHGHHQKRTRHFLKVYWPYVPLLVIVFSGLVLSSASYWSPQRNSVLGYATNITSSGLLSETNAQRSINSIGTLALNSQLSQAAQAKAEDMVARNYWSHNTPDGKTPWTFIDATGYAYQKAGENLAYGFDTSSDTVTGWMNSPPHKANILDSGYSVVGFGFANSSNFQDNGEQTIVVALYATPTTTPVPAVAQSQPTATTGSSAQPTPSPTTAENQADTAQPTEIPVEEPKPDVNAALAAYTTIPGSSEPASQNIARLQTVTGGRAPWLPFVMGVLSGVGGAIVIIKHGLAVRRAFTYGERFIVRHAVFDVTVVAFGALWVIASHSVGVIR